MKWNDFLRDIAYLAVISIIIASAISHYTDVNVVFLSFFVFMTTLMVIHLLGYFNGEY